MISLDVLENLKPFKNLDDNQLVAMQELSEEIEFKRNERLFAQGDDSAHLWFILKGKVELRADGHNAHMAVFENPVSFTSETEVFGWSSFMTPYKYRLSGYCASRSCAAIRIKKERLMDLFGKDPLIGFHVMSYVLRVIGIHLHQFQDELAKRKGEDILSGW